MFQQSTGDNSGLVNLGGGCAAENTPESGKTSWSHGFDITLYVRKRKTTAAVRHTGGVQHFISILLLHTDTPLSPPRPPQGSDGEKQFLAFPAARLSAHGCTFKSRPLERIILDNNNVLQPFCSTIIIFFLLLPTSVLFITNRVRKIENMREFSTLSILNVFQHISHQSNPN